MPYVTKKLIADGWLARLLIVSWLACGLLAYGCASEPLTEDEQLERETNEAVDRENWWMCEKILRQHGAPTYHDNHSHQGRLKTRLEDVRQDLWTNNCRRVLGPYWIDK